MGLHGIAMSRYSGLWSAMKIVTNVADGGAVIDVHPDLALPVLPELEFNDGASVACHRASELDLSY